jgi:hypothetical protein
VLKAGVQDNALEALECRLVHARIELEWSHPWCRRDSSVGCSAGVDTLWSTGKKERGQWDGSEVWTAGTLYVRLPQHWDGPRRGRYGGRGRDARILLRKTKLTTGSHASVEERGGRGCSSVLLGRGHDAGPRRVEEKEGEEVGRARGPEGDEGEEMSPRWFSFFMKCFPFSFPTIPYKATREEIQIRK